MQRPPEDYQMGNNVQREGGKRVIDKYISNVGPDDHVIDIGCGTGETSFYLQRKFNCHLTAVDVNESMITYVKQNYPSDRIVAERMDIQNLDLQKKERYHSHFSLAISFFTLHWVSDMDSACENINWLLKPGGRVLLVIPVFPEPHKFLSAMTTRIMESPRWKRWVNYKNLENMGVPWLLASMNTSKGVYWLKERNAFKEIMSRHGFDVIRQDMIRVGFPLTKDGTKSYYAVLDMVPEAMREDLLDDIMAVVEEERMADDHACQTDETVECVILDAVKRTEN